MFTNLLIEVFKLLTSKFNAGEEVHHYIYTAVLDSNLKLEI